MFENEFAFEMGINDCYSEHIDNKKNFCELQEL